MNSTSRKARPASPGISPELRRLQQVTSRVFSTPEGREVIRHLAARFGLAARVFQPGQEGAVCPLRAAVRDGERAVVIHLLNLCSEDCPEILAGVLEPPAKPTP